MAAAVRLVSRPGLRLTLASMALMQLAPLLNKFALGGLRPLQAALLNSVFVLGFVATAVVVRRRGFRLVSGRPTLLLVLGLADAVGVIFIYASLSYVTPAAFALLGRLYLVIAVILGTLFLGERVTPLDWCLIAASVLGSGLFSFYGSIGGSSLGIVLVLGYTISFAVSNLLAKFAVSSAEPMSILFVSKSIGVLFLTGYGLLAGELLVPLSGGVRAAVWYVLASAVLSNVIGLLLFYESLKRLPFYVVNAIRSVGPIFAALYAWRWFPEPLSIGNLLGGFVVVVSVGLLAVRHSRERASVSASVDG